MVDSYMLIKAEVVQDQRYA